MPKTRQDLLTHLQDIGITVKNHDHQAVFTVEQAKQVHDNIAGGHCKNLFCKDEKGALWLIVALEDSVINLKAAPGRIGSKRLTFGKPDLLLEVLGVAPGSVTPFGLINDTSNRTNVILDAVMMEHDILNFHPLENNATTSIASSDLIKFIESCGHKPRVVNVSDT